MHRYRIPVSVIATLAHGAVLAQAASTLPAPPEHAYDFAYRVTGDKRVAPVQVFDDGRQTYMQFRAGQVAPAIFHADGRAERLAAVAWQGGYAVIGGTAREFTLRIGAIVARARYQGPASRSGPGMPLRAADSLAEFAEEEGFPPASAAAAEPSMGMMDAGMSAAVRTAAASRMDMPARPPAALYEATPADRTMRQALGRWAKSAGWTFDAEHWTVDVDIPLAGSARLGRDFKAAVRDLLAATELSAHPLQPCFYSNRVLRVIPIAEACDRTAFVADRRG